MKDAARKLKFNSLFSKNEYESEYSLGTASEEAQICLTCTAKRCKGECERLRIERKKLKALGNK